MEKNPITMANLKILKKQTKALSYQEITKYLKEKDNSINIVELEEEKRLLKEVTVVNIPGVTIQDLLQKMEKEMKKKNIIKMNTISIMC